MLYALFVLACYAVILSPLWVPCTWRPSHDR